jgi:uncharacterized protein YndB with AHSA1/START domain
MTEIVASIEISRSPVDVFAYATDLSRYAEWQPGVTAARLQGSGPIRAGSRAVVTRRVGPRTVEYIEEMVELDPPWRWTVRSIGGLPVTATARGAIESLDGGHRSRITITLDFQAHGIGKLLLPLVVRRQARKTLPKEAQELKLTLERPGSGVTLDTGWGESSGSRGGEGASRDQGA